MKKIGTGTMPKGFSVAATRAPMPKKPKTRSGMPRPTREHVLAGIVDGTVFETGIYSQSNLGRIDAKVTIVSGKTVACFHAIRYVNAGTSDETMEHGVFAALSDAVDFMLGAPS